MQQMSEPQWRAFVSAGTRTGKLAVLAGDGAPHVTPIWFVLDDGTGAGDSTGPAGGTGELVFTTGEDSVKGRALRRDPRFALCVDAEEPPYSYVLLHCRVRAVEHGVHHLLPWTTRIGGRYMGAELAETFGRRNAVPEEMLVRAQIVRAVAYRDITG